jgi:hypothetical protein
MPAFILFGSINANALDTQSIVGVGENSQNAWNSHSKNVFGNGIWYGLVNSQGNIQFVTDTSVINTPIIEQDFKPVSEIQA